jgi:hypothetical protein
MVTAVWQEHHQGAGPVLSRRPAIKHRERHTDALHPLVSTRLQRPAFGCKRGLDQIEALIETIAAEFDIADVFPDRFNPVLRPDHVSPPDFKRA